MTTTEFLDLRLRELLDRVAAPEPAPGGGSVLALVAALAAGILAMAARASADFWEDAGGVAAQAEMLRARAAPLAQVDAETYERALAVRDDHAELDEERRDWEIGRAFAAAAEPPLQIARVAADIAELAQEVASRADQRLRPDALAAAALASAVARACAELVAVNLTATEDDPRVREAHSHAEAAQRAAATAFAA
ncbi:MAG: cyclodeaminase/cyclohydrolase family protein [Actinobacteria bacterium]|nr:MAG: cyclodeaminase/cyclohydrolase family protein [Actinomycetota bacterium]